MSEQSNEPTATSSWGSPQGTLRQLGIALLIAACWALVLGVIIAPRAAPQAPVKGDVLTWDDHVFPVMQQYCTACHGASGGLSLTSYEDALAGGVSGPAIVPGDADDSLLYQVLLGPVGSIPSMPLGQQLLPEATIDVVGDWIDGLAGK
jgi:hypothetical protein